MPIRFFFSVFHTRTPLTTWRTCPWQSPGRHPGSDQRRPEVASQAAGRKSAASTQSTASQAQWAQSRRPFAKYHASSRGRSKLAEANATRSERERERERECVCVCVCVCVCECVCVCAIKRAKGNNKRLPTHRSLCGDAVVVEEPHGNGSYSSQIRRCAQECVHRQNTLFACVRVRVYVCAQVVEAEW